ncbi:helix-turn-helix transcriptional regulator [Myxococcota bacterium]
MNRKLTTHDLGQLLNLADQTIRHWRHDGRGPRYHRLGGPRSRVLYDPEEVERWLAEREAGSTSEESARAQMAARSGR